MMPTTQRRADWPERLAAAIERADGRPLQWGVFDCCTWAADVVHEMTGRDPIADLRGQWDSALGAQRMLQQLGGLQAALQARLGQPLASVRLAQRGDVVLLLDRERHAAAICAGGVALVPAPVGLTRVPMVAAAGAVVVPLMAWRV